MTSRGWTYHFCNSAGLLLHLNVGTVGRAEQGGGFLPEPQHEGGLQGARPRDGCRGRGGCKECGKGELRGAGDPNQQ